MDCEVHWRFGNLDGNCNISESPDGSIYGNRYRQVHRKYSLEFLSKIAKYHQKSRRKQLWNKFGVLVEHCRIPPKKSQEATVEQVPRGVSESVHQRIWSRPQSHRRLPWSASLHNQQIFLTIWKSITPDNLQKLLGSTRGEWKPYWTPTKATQNIDGISLTYAVLIYE